VYWRTQEEGRKEDDMKRLLLLGGWAVAGVAAIPQMICGLGGQATGPVSPPGSERGGVHARADNDENGLHVRGANRGKRSGAATSVGIDSSSRAANDGAAVSGGGNGGGGATSSGCANQGQQVSGDSDADVNLRENDPDADGDGVADADIRPRCEPGIGADVAGSGDVDS
jgi:hypothetical protein